MLNITRFSIQSPELKPWVKFIWHLKMDCETTVNHKLLPTDSIDIVMNRAAQITYLFGSAKIEAPDFHFNGMRNRYGFIRQTGRPDVFGISFYPFGLYPFIQTPLSIFRDQIADLKSASEFLYRQFDSVIDPLREDSETAALLEKVLLAALNISKTDENALPLLQMFYCAGQEVAIKEFCLQNHITQKTFERTCLKYTGLTPKVLQRLKRFRGVSNQLIYSGSETDLASLAFDHEYYDQSHFIKEFKDFSGASPGQFQSDHITVKENTNYNFK